MKKLFCPEENAIVWCFYLHMSHKPAHYLMSRANQLSVYLYSIRSISRYLYETVCFPAVYTLMHGDYTYPVLITYKVAQVLSTDKYWITTAAAVRCQWWAIVFGCASLKHSQNECEWKWIGGTRADMRETEKRSDGNGTWRGEWAREPQHTPVIYTRAMCEPLIQRLPWNEREKTTREMK